MPLVVFCGYPASGKSTWVDKLKTYLTEDKGLTVAIVKESEHFRGEKNSILDGEWFKKRFEMGTMGFCVEISVKILF